MEKKWKTSYHAVFQAFSKRLGESEQQTKVLNFKGKIAKLKGLYCGVQWITRI